MGIEKGLESYLSRRADYCSRLGNLFQVYTGTTGDNATVVVLRRFEKNRNQVRTRWHFAIVRDGNPTLPMIAKRDHTITAKKLKPKLDELFPS